MMRVKLFAPFFCNSACLRNFSFWYLTDSISVVYYTIKCRMCVFLLTWFVHRLQSIHEVTAGSSTFSISSQNGGIVAYLLAFFCQQELVSLSVLGHHFLQIPLLKNHLRTHFLFSRSGILKSGFSQNPT